MVTNAELFVALFVSLDGSRELHVLLQMTRPGSEDLIQECLLERLESVPENPLVAPRLHSSFY